MKRPILGILVFLLAALGSGSAMAQRHGHGGHGGHRGHGGVHFGLSFGVPLAWHSPWYYYPPPAYYYYPGPVVVQPPSPPTYVERSDVVPEGAGSWYFCRESNGYYPYVKQCPGGWQRVPAQPTQ